MFLIDFIVDVLSTILLLLYGALGGNVFLAIVVFTVLVRLSIMPLTLKQQRSMKNMQELSPKLRELQKKYKDDRERLVQEQMALYRENGVNPMAGCLPLLIQLPIIFSLWRTIIAVLASNPRQLVELQDRILIDGLDHLVPLSNTFLWLNLALPDPYYILPVLVGITTFLQQKMIMPITPKKPATRRKPGEPIDPTEQTQQMMRQMTIIMPFFLAFISATYASGISIYFVVSNVFGIIQYSAMGKADVRRLFGIEPKKDEDEATATIPEGDEDESAEGAPARSLEEQVVAQAGAAVAAGPQLKPGIAVMTLKPNPPSSAKPKRSSTKSNGNRNKSKSGGSSSSKGNRSRKKSKKR
jgi:YidC/Oxa1 family membrane protein insertase